MSLRTQLLAAPLALALAAGALAAQAPGPPLNLANLDTTCAPCKNFYRYANGGWLDANPVPAAYSTWSSFNELTERNNEVLRGVLDRAAAAAETTTDPNTRRLGRFYATCMDSTRAEADGYKPLEPELRQIAGLRTKEDVLAQIARMHNMGMGGGFGFYATADARNSRMNIAEASQGGLGLPDRDYYTRTDSASAAMRTKYTDHLARMFEMVGVPAAQAAQDAQRVLALETALAQASKTRVQLRDPNALYNKMTVAQAEAGGFPWASYLRQRGVTVDSLNVQVPDFFRALGTALADRPVADWQAYLRARVVGGAANWLSTPFVQQAFRFSSALSGARELQPRWRRCLRMADGMLGDALGQEYVKTAFTPQAKATMGEMLTNLRATMRERLERLAWMSQATREQAIGKLGTMDGKVGYPDVWDDYAGLEIGTGSFIDNVRAANVYHTADNMKDIGQPVDRTEWYMTAPTVNAYYNPSTNEIGFPAGRLQPPFFHPSFDIAANYGGIGGTIGHEVTHGFDDEGRQYDAQGNLRDWWTAEDAKNFEERAAVVERQYNAYTVLDTVHVNGKLTLGENIADIGGLTVAYYALQKALEGKPRTLIDGFTPEQRFFLAYAQARRANMRPEQLRLMIQTDPHSPGEFRVNGPVSNMPEFAAAFGCKPGDPMVRPESERASIW